jgi:cyclophilin family peptidyl-prolyl cis-trans isomerase
LVKSVSTKADGWRLRLSAPPKQEFQADCDYFWHVDTAVGPLKIRLFGDTAPMHVTSAIYLARLGFYDGLNFHRVIPGFMAQGGCPEGSGRGSPGYKYDGEFKGGRKHDKPGILSMANAGPGTDGSQFFLTFVPTPHLDGRHTVWGEVVDGAETLKALEKLGSSANNGMLANGPKMKSTWVTVVPKKSEKPDAHGKDGKDGKDGEHGKKGESGGGR